MLQGDAKSWIKAAVGLTNYLRSPATPGNQPAEGETALGDKFRKFANQLARVLPQIARELVEVMRRDIKLDWTVRDDVKAKLRSSIKRLLVKYKYPLDKQLEAIRLVIEQMESLAPSMLQQ
ncbi:MAG: type I restriction enzyme endonuclease domain-containing protein [Nocardioides sp.]